MKIIKKGKIPEEKIYQGRCGNCHTEIEFKLSEAEWTNIDTFDGSRALLKCSCPLCKSGVYVWP